VQGRRSAVEEGQGRECYAYKREEMLLWIRIGNWKKYLAVQSLENLFEGEEFSNERDLIKTGGKKEVKKKGKGRQMDQHAILAGWTWGGRNTKVLKIKLMEHGKGGTARLGGGKAGKKGV